MSIERAALAFTTTIALVGAVVAVESRYASADEVDRMRSDNAIYHLERRIEDTQDKLNGIVIIPLDQRREWQRREVHRLEKNIQKYERQMLLLFEQEDSLWK